MATVQKNLIKKVKEYKEKYIEIAIMNFCDLLESEHSSGRPTQSTYAFFQTIMLVYSKADELEKGAILVFDGKNVVIKEKERPKFNFGNLFKTFDKDEALKIKDTASTAENPTKALAEAGYEGKDIGKIIKTLKS